MSTLREEMSWAQKVTYVARNLEPYRGFPNFMRSLPAILERRPNAHVLIVGGDEVSYGHRLPDGQPHKQTYAGGIGLVAGYEARAFPGQGALPGFLEGAAGIKSARVSNFSVRAVVVNAGSDVCGLPGDRIENSLCRRQ